MNTESSTSSEKKTNNRSETKKLTSDTDFYYDIIANKNKVIEISSESSTDVNNIIDLSSSDSSKKSRSSKSSSKSSTKSIISLGKDKGPFISGMQFNNSNSNNTNTQNINIPYVEPIINVKTLTPQEIRMRKIELLRQLSELKTKGYALSKEYDFNSSIEEMEYEYGLLKSFADKRYGVYLYKQFILNVITMVELMNNKYDPFDFKLKGWSDHMNMNIDSMEDLIEELYEKYKSTGSGLPVEVRLVGMIFFSGLAFHSSKSYLNGDTTLNNMATGFLSNSLSSKKENKFMSPQEINIEKQKQLFKEKEKLLKQKVNHPVPGPNRNPTPSPNNNSTVNNDFGPPNMFGLNAPINNIPKNSNSRDIPEIRAPSSVQEILNRIKKINSNVDDNSTETQDETTTVSNNRLVSESTITEKKRGRKPAKPPSISINTN